MAMGDGGHHARPGDAWDFCGNNVRVDSLRLQEKAVKPKNRHAHPPREIKLLEKVSRGRPFPPPWTEIGAHLRRDSSLANCCRADFLAASLSLNCF